MEDNENQVDIYKDDKLNREVFVNKMKTIIENNAKNEKGNVFLLSGQFGSGKTTVLEYLEKELSSNNIAHFNCWENNFFNNPMLALLYSLQNLRRFDEKIKNEFQKLVSKIPKAVIKTIDNAINTEFETLTNQSSIFEDYKNYKNTIEEIKALLKEKAEKWPIIICIDELDRCMPEYQIQLLENIHHLLNIDNVTVLIAVDKAQLEKTIEMHFGNNNNVNGYLTKFIDYEFVLPTENIANIIENIYFSKSEDYDIELITLMLNLSNFSVRESIKIIKSSLILIPKNYLNERFYYFFLLCLIIKTKEPTIYENYIIIKNDNIKYSDFENEIFASSLKILWKEISRNYIKYGIKHYLKIKFLAYIEKDETKIKNNYELSKIEQNFMDEHNCNYYYHLKFPIGW